MLQLTAGLPFLQWPVPSTFSLTVVKPAPVTGLLASAGGMLTNSAVLIATRPVQALKPNHLFTGSLPSLHASGRRQSARRHAVGGPSPWAAEQSRAGVAPFPLPPRADSTVTLSLGTAVCDINRTFVPIPVLVAAAAFQVLPAELA